MSSFTSLSRWLTTQVLMENRDDRRKAEDRGMEPPPSEWSPLVIDLDAIESYADDGTHDTPTAGGEVITDRITHLCTRSGAEMAVRIPFPDFDAMMRKRRERRDDESRE